MMPADDILDHESGSPEGLSDYQLAQLLQWEHLPEWLIEPLELEKERRGLEAPPAAPAQEKPAVHSNLPLYFIVLINLWLSRFVFKGPISGTGELILGGIGLLGVYLCWNLAWKAQQYWQRITIILLALVVLLFGWLWII